MDKAICSRCKVKKEKSTENFHFRNDTKSFRRMCKTCMKNKTFKRIKSKTYYYEDMLEIFKRNGLTPLMEKHDNAIPVKQRIDSIDSDGYKVRATIDKLKSRQDKPRPFSSHNPHTIENIQKFINDNDLGFIVISDKFVKNSSSIKMICPKGHLFGVAWSDFKRRKRCTKCYCSQGEEKIQEWLMSEGITFKTEYTFDDLRGEKNQPLRYDFAVFENNGLSALIEYDGELHFKVSRYSKKKEDNLKRLKKIQAYDARKNKYAEDNKINLLRIPYTEYDNIEEILTTHLL